MSLFAFGVGAVTWTLLEYVLHRFVFHQRVLGVAASAEHARHHATVDWFAPWRSKLTLAGFVLVPAIAVVTPLTGLAFAWPWVSGIVGGWLVYEALHRAVHVVGPRGPYGRWARRHHLHHHFANPRANHGVSSPIWDWVFGTLEPVPFVTIPRRQANKFPWLLNPDDEVRPELAGTYRLGGRARPQPPGEPGAVGSLSSS